MSRLRLRNVAATAEIMMRVKRFGLYAIAWLLFTVSLRGTAGPDAPLADAAEKMDRASIRTLLQKRVDVNTPQIDGMTALHWATYQDDLEIAELLVRAGANVKAASRYGVTPLSLACTNGNGAMVERLLKAGADPNTAWLKGCVVLDAKGFVKTGADLNPADLEDAAWPLARRPELLETSRPGVFAVGDVRSGSVKRVASAVGEGSVCVQLIHRALRDL